MAETRTKNRKDLDFTSGGLMGFASGWVIGFTLNFVAFAVSVALAFKHYGRLRQRSEERAAWKAHEHHDLYPTMHEVRTFCASILGGRAAVRFTSVAK